MITDGILVAFAVLGFWQLVLRAPVRPGAEVPIGLSWGRTVDVGHIDLGEWRFYAHGFQLHLCLPVGLGCRHNWELHTVVAKLTFGLNLLSASTYVVSKPI